MTLEIVGATARLTRSVGQKSQRQSHKFLVDTFLNLAILAATTATMVSAVGTRHVMPAVFIYLLPVAIATWFWGFEQGFIMTLGSALAGAYFFFDPGFSIRVAEPHDIISLAIFLGAATLVGFLVDEFRAKYRTRLDLDLSLPAQSSEQSPAVAPPALNFSEPTRTIPERVTEFLVTAEHQMYCDQCIQEKLGLRWRQQVQLVTATLAVTGLFQRSAGLCCHCRQSKQAIRHVGGR